LPDTEPPSAPPHRPVSAPAARRTDHAHPPARADGPRAPSHTGWTAHGGGRPAGTLRADGRIPGTLPRGRTAGTLPRERTHRCPAPSRRARRPPGRGGRPPRRGRTTRTLPRERTDRGRPRTRGGRLTERDGSRAPSRAGEPQAPSHASGRIAARRQPVRAPPDRPSSASPAQQAGVRTGCSCGVRVRAAPPEYI